MPRLALHPLDLASCVGFLAYSASAVVTPICLVALRDELEFGLTLGGTLDVVRHGLILGVLLLSGFLAARWGKPVVLGWSLAVQGLGLLLFSVAPSYAVIALASGLIGVGSGSIEGLINPLVRDLHPHDSGRYLNFTNAAWSVGVLLTVLIAGELLTRGVSWRSISAGLGVFGLGAGLLFLMLARTHGHAASHGLMDVLGHKREVLASGRFWLFAWAMVFGGAAEGAFTFWTASYIQLHHHGSARAAGVGTAAFALGMIVGRVAFSYYVPQRRLRRLILISAAAGLVVSAALPMAASLNMLYAVLFAAGLSIACFWPSIQSYAVDRTGLDPTAVFILLSCAGIPGISGAAWLMGLVGDLWGLSVSFVLVPGFFLMLLAVMLAERRWGGAGQL